MVKGLNELLILGGVLVGSYFLFGRKSTIKQITPTIQRQEQDIKTATLGEINLIESQKERLQFLKETYQEQLLTFEQQQASAQISLLEQSKSAAARTISGITAAIAQTVEPAHISKRSFGRTLINRARRKEIIESKAALNAEVIRANQFIETADSQIIQINQRLEEIEALAEF